MLCDSQDAGAPAGVASGRAGRPGAASVLRRGKLLGGVRMGLCVAVVGSRSLAGSWACCPLALGRWLPAPGLPGLSIITGGAPGVDAAAAAWAARVGVPCVALRPAWSVLGRAAGPARNAALAARADAAVVVFDARPGAPVSRGSLDVLARLQRAGVPCRVVRVLS